jgi:hypothetical protein
MLVEKEQNGQVITCFNVAPVGKPHPLHGKPDTFETTPNPGELHEGQSLDRRFANCSVACFITACLIGLNIERMSVSTETVGLHSFK